MIGKVTKNCEENREASETMTKHSRIMSKSNIAITISVVALLFTALAYFSNQAAESRNTDLQASATAYEFFNLLGMDLRPVGTDGEKLVQRRIVRGADTDVSEDDLREALELINKYALLKPDDLENIEFMQVIHAMTSQDIDRFVSLLVAQGEVTANYGGITTEEIVPPKAQAYLYGGIMAANLSSPEIAREYMELALIEAPKSPYVLHSYGFFLHSIEENSASVELMKRAIVADPNNPAHYTILGHVYAESDQMELAESVLRLAITMEPESAQTFNTLGGVLAYQDKHQEAVENYRKAIDRDPHDGLYYKNIEISLRHLGRNAEADLAEEKARQYTERD